MMAETLNLHPSHAFGLCVRFWCDDQMATEDAIGVTYPMLDAILGQPGFCEALVKVGWIRSHYGRIRVVNFDRHLSQSIEDASPCEQAEAELSGTLGPRQPRSQKREEERREYKFYS